MKKTIIGKYKYFLFGVLVILATSSCDTLKYIEKDQSFLAENRIEFKRDKSVKDKSQLKLELEQFYLQQPNNKFLGVTRRWYYYKNQNPGDTSWFKKWVKKSIAEEPAIYDSILSQQTANSMEKYLQNKKGFYLAEVDVNTKSKYQKASTVYTVKPGPQYTIRSIEYISKDTALLKVIESIKEDAVITRGSPVESSSFELERNRISIYLQNNGYANFNINYIEILGDSSNLKFDVFFEIKTPNQQNKHQKYSIGDIHVYTDNIPNTEGIIKDSFDIGPQRFYRTLDQYLVKPRALSKSIYLKTGEEYRKRDVQKTYRKLSNFGPYRFINVNPRVDSIGDTIVHYDIILSPNPNNWIADYGSEFFYSTLSQVGRNLFGFSLNSQFQNNNIFRGGEKYTIGLEAGLEFDISNLNINTLSLGFNNDLEVPRLIDFYKTFKIFNKIGLISDRNYNFIKDETKTTFNLGYNLTKLLDFYTINSFNLSLGYDYQPSAYNRYLINQIGLNLWLPATETRFEEDFLKDNPFLQNSFERRLLTGFFFRDFTYIHTGRENRRGFSTAFIGSLELSGGEIFLANKLISPNNDWTIGNIEFGKFVKFELDQRFYKRFNSTSSFASRFNFGMAVPFGDNDAVTYIKQFFSGGPNSIRAWQIRELGPGRFIAQAMPNNVPFFQAGDLKMEFNFEYRFKLFWILRGALFLEGGNIWTLKEDSARPGAKISSEFYKEIALGSGFGVRWDFTYFLIRFDLGYRLRNPYPDPVTGSYWPYNNFTEWTLGKANINVAVNYPF